MLSISSSSFLRLHYQNFGWQFNGPKQAAEALAEFFPDDRASKLILDVAAGTGLVGEQVS